ncbi:XRE family transcriptional regulator [Chryseobacterium arthrosphaerae]|uniref:XRE family transcriptional regulator n=1 Tax=Chryseobacterium arthrosphaerae TaxID=651561 RepID=UPI000F4E0509|nr:XRE family transcriptional regulator [Chryseobacterium arthrosphaerae]AYZ12920.1 XRE family transcriptional regulator [Chryseobacterium arthrosphaerae]
METLAQKIKEKSITVYQTIAKKHNTDAEYVGKIARGERKPIRGKGLKILKELENITDNKLL